MESYEIWGGRPLKGNVRVSGAKNAVLPILAACVMIPGETVLDHCPDLTDVRNMCRILEHLGCVIHREGDVLRVDGSGVHRCSIPHGEMKMLRSSVFLAGPMLARLGQIVLESPGGCAIGNRPIDLHLQGLTSLGAKIRQREDRLFCRASHLRGTEIELSYPSVGATETILMASVLSSGTTLLKNAAREPEIVDLQNFLNGCGGRISGAGTPEIRVEGVGELHPIRYSIMGDRVEGGTYLMAAAITGGEITVEGLDPSWMLRELDVLRKMDCDISSGIQGELPYVTLKGPQRLKAPGLVRCEPWPGFSTDLQSPLMALCTVAEGSSIIEDTVFERRFSCGEELRKLGAHISVEGRTATVTGSRSFRGGAVIAGDLRGGAALVVAALGIPHQVIVENICHIYRGYGKFDIALTKLGADIVKRENHGRKTEGIPEKQEKKKEKKKEALSAEDFDFDPPCYGDVSSDDIPFI